MIGGKTDFISGPVRRLLELPQLILPVLDDLSAALLKNLKV
jgi:hypothetical protein